MTAVPGPNLLRVLATLLALAITPVLLAAWIGAPIPHNLPTVEQVQELMEGLTPRHLHAFLRIVVWLAWLAILLGTMWELGSWVRHRGHRRSVTARPWYLRLTGALVLGSTATTAIATTTTAVADLHDLSDRRTEGQPLDQDGPEAHATPPPPASTSAITHAIDGSPVTMAAGVVVSMSFTLALASAVLGARQRRDQFRRLQPRRTEADIDLALPHNLEVCEPTPATKPYDDHPALIGTDKTGRPITIAHATAGGIGLAGPGAPSVARAAIAAALAAGGHGPDSAGVDVLITRNLLAELTGTRELPGIFRLWVVSTSTAERRLFGDIMGKTRDAEDSTTPPGQTLAVLESGTIDAETLETLLAQGRTLNVGAIILGDWKSSTFHIDNSGNVDAPTPETAHEPQHCFVMDSATFTDTLSVLTNIAATAEDPPDEQHQPESPNAQPFSGSIAQQPGGSPEPPIPTSVPPVHVEIPTDLPIRHGKALRRAVTDPKPPPDHLPHHIAPPTAPPEQPHCAPAYTATEPVATPKVRVTVFGNVHATANDAPIKFTRTKGRELLALLATNTTGITADTVSECIVGDTQVSKARSHLASIVTSTRGDLRRATGTDKSAMFITFHNDLYRLDTDRVTTDLTDITYHLTAAQTATDPADRARHLVAAVDLYTGDFATDITDDTWPEPIRTAHRNELHRACLDLADLHAKANDPTAVQSVLKRATSIDPYDEAAYRMLIEAALAAGDRDRARTTYLRLKTHLAKIGETPSDEVRRLLSKQPGQG